MKIEQIFAFFCGIHSDTVKGNCFEGIGIPVFDEGKVVQRGSYEELAAQKGMSTKNSKQWLTIMAFRCKLTVGKWLTI